MVVAGTVAEWAGFGDDAWRQRITSLGEVASAAGASWLTVRPYAQGEGERHVNRREQAVGDDEEQGCTVIIDPTVDGHARFAAAMADLGDVGDVDDVDSAASVDEAMVAAALYRPALAEPDLVLVVGRDDRLPASLVWELGYAELVFVDRSWERLDAGDLAAAIDEFAGRSRRFGGLP